jgi:hypothetical protein
LAISFPLFPSFGSMAFFCLAPLISRSDYLPVCLAHEVRSVPWHHGSSDSIEGGKQNVDTRGE